MRDGIRSPSAARVARRTCPGEIMKLAAYVVGIVLIILAAIYLAMPADSLPSFLPGYDPGMTRPRLKHGIASGVVGVILILAGWYLGRSRS